MVIVMAVHWCKADQGGTSLNCAMLQQFTLWVCGSTCWQGGVGGREAQGGELCGPWARTVQPSMRGPCTAGGGVHGASAAAAATGRAGRGVVPPCNTYHPWYLWSLPPLWCTAPPPPPRGPSSRTRADGTAHRALWVAAAWGIGQLRTCCLGHGGGWLGWGGGRRGIVWGGVRSGASGEASQLARTCLVCRRGAENSVRDSVRGVAEGVLL